ncbi:hypothetical protein PCANC_20388 [Puccinia coronata f. sp. avenae]|nr:hypothetical protein PCANC_26417 [Puccinia coronata f. sp. avenae]PLW36207.1 hypothetical protein PCANC_20388 [Puccinia coronata f. sp. avenae]
MACSVSLSWPAHQAGLRSAGYTDQAGHGLLGHGLLTDPITTCSLSREGTSSGTRLPLPLANQAPGTATRVPGWCGGFTPGNSPRCGPAMPSQGHVELWAGADLGRPSHSGVTPQT